MTVGVGMAAQAGCGSGLARDAGGDGPDANAGKPAPTGNKYPIDFKGNNFRILWALWSQLRPVRRPGRGRSHR